MLNDLLIAQAAIAIRPEPFRTENSPLAFQPLSPSTPVHFLRSTELTRDH